MKDFPTYFTSEHALCMTLRDYFAAKAMASIQNSHPNTSYENLGKHAYLVADEMMKAREL